jgi:hypothetical protein
MLGSAQVYGETPSIVVDFVASGGIPTRGQGARHVGIFVGTSLAFCFVKIGLGMRLGPHGLGDGLCGLVMGFHTHKKVYFCVDFVKGLLTHPLDLYK